MAETRRYTAQDIEKYHHGQLSAAEMHALEKAALDDPFLAEAIEGYRFPGDHASATGMLKKQLAARTRKFTALPLLRVAAVLVLLVGAGLLLRLITNPQEKEIAQVPAREVKQTSPATDSIPDTTPGSPIVTHTESGGSGSTSTNSGKLSRQRDEPIVSKKETAVSVPPVAVEETGKDRPLEEIVVHPAVPKTETAVKEMNRRKIDENEDVSNRSKRAGPYRQMNNYLRGRVTDPKNNPVPFANITNTADSTATYADADGNFRITASDTTVDVHVRSVGYESSRARLSENSSNQIKLRDAPGPTLDEVVAVTGTKPQRKSVFDKRKHEGPEPEDGWENYGMYLVNNLQLPGDFGDRNGTVEISFQVDRMGRPFNIRVEKSLCPPCDAEAIRLIREGPRWESRTRKGRAVVAVPFTSYHR